MDCGQSTPTERSSGPVRREAVTVGIGGALLAAAALAFIVARLGQASLFRNDAEFFWAIARDPFGTGHALRANPGLGVAYRFGRPLFPAVAWVLALGHKGLVRWTLMLVDAVAFGATLACAGELLARRGRRAIDGIAILLVPGVWWAVVLAISEPMVIALMLLLFIAYLDGRRTAAYLLAALLLLTRESAGLAIVPLAIADVRRAGWRHLLPWGATVVPVLAWWTWIRFRIGQWPPLDPSESRRGALSAPFVGYWHIKGGMHPSDVAAFVLAAATVLLPSGCGDGVGAGRCRTPQCCSAP